MEQQENESEHEVSERLACLLKWGSELGISDASTEQPRPTSNSCLGFTLCVSHFPNAGGRGLAAIRDLKRGEAVLKVPKSALMTTQSLLQTDNYLSSAFSDHLSLSSTQRLCVCLLYEMGKGKNSWWYPYLGNLPRSYDILATFNDFHAQALQVEDAIWTAQRAVSRAKSEWEEACSLMEELRFRPQLQTFTSWLWASATISSRTLHVPWDEAGCLCPVGDLFNYAAPGEDSDDAVDNAPPRLLQPGTHCSNEFDNKLDQDFDQCDGLVQRLTDGGYEEDAKAYCFFAKKSYKKGDQVLLSYGTYTNLELLEYYGFLLDENPNDKVYISLDPVIYSCTSWPRELLYIDQNGNPSFALLSSLRLWATPPNQRRSAGHLAYSGCQISWQNELCVLNLLIQSCDSTLKNLLTTVEDDSRLLSGIDKVHDISTFVEIHNALSMLGKEGSAFSKYHTLQNRGAQAISQKIRRSIGRWRLAVQWRLRYKMTLVDCISSCSKLISPTPSKSISILDGVTNDNDSLDKQDN